MKLFQDKRLGIFVALASSSTVQGFLPCWKHEARHDYCLLQQGTTISSSPVHESSTTTIEQMQREIANLQEQLLHQQRHNHADLNNNKDLIRALLRSQLQLTAAEIQQQEQAAVEAHQDMEDAIREVRNAFILKEQAQKETRHALDEATWLMGVDDNHADLETLVLAHAVHDVRQTEVQWQAATVKRLHALGREVRAKDILWTLTQHEEGLKQLLLQANNHHDSQVLQNWIAGELLPKQQQQQQQQEEESLVNRVKNNLAARDEIV